MELNEEDAGFVLELEEAVNRIPQRVRREAFAKGLPVIYMQKGQVVWEYEGGIKIHKANVEDIPEVCRIVGLMSPPDKPHNYKNAVEKFTSHIQNNPDYYLWVAELEGKVVGTAMMHLQHKLSYECGTAAHLEDVVVDLPYRKKLGIGKRLVERAIDTAKKLNCYKIFLTCYSKTTNYYEKLGFKQHDIGMRLNLK